MGQEISAMSLLNSKLQNQNPSTISTPDKSAEDTVQGASEGPFTKEKEGDDSHLLVPTSSYLGYMTSLERFNIAVSASSSPTVTIYKLESARLKSQRLRVFFSCQQAKPALNTLISARIP